jgi:hypothetical protein
MLDAAKAAQLEAFKVKLKAQLEAAEVGKHDYLAFCSTEYVALLHSCCWWRCG